MQAQCKTCKEPMTWREQRRQYGRCVRRGMTKFEIQEALPRCQKCLTQHRQEMQSAVSWPVAEGVGQGGEPAPRAGGERILDTLVQNC
ncbi:MAG: hypothetical protein JXM70_01480 [Pirellulales bacterium]|nr:hypothetical protein [Pirellulales bacterium]